NGNWQASPRRKPKANPGMVEKLAHGSKVTEEKETVIRQLHDKGDSIAAIARTVGLTRKSIYRALGREFVGS
ncbi:MAG: helix-turn-helix domain-containing protein, partial [Planctomycetaceae bacterium]